LSNSINFEIKFSKFSKCNIFGPSLGALSGSLCVSIKIPATPTAAAAFDKVVTNYLLPPLFSPNPPGS